MAWNTAHRAPTGMPGRQQAPKSVWLDLSCITSHAPALIPQHLEEPQYELILPETQVREQKQKETLSQLGKPGLQPSIPSGLGVRL